jgi:prepilin-type N-terminal cleavage/methylation domain-containing protein/prepilin-type processing-associated H-X9-DG protein
MQPVSHRQRPGFTLVELLVSIVILLIGVYAVVAGFPRLRAVLEDDKLRTERTRNVQSRFDWFAEHAEQLPFSVTFDPAAITGLDPGLLPQANTPNLRDDLSRVIGESFYLRRGAGAALHVLNFGPADTGPSGLVVVMELLPLQRAPNPIDPLNVDEYRILDADLTTGIVDVVSGDPTDSAVQTPTGFHGGRDIVANYAWVDGSGRVRYTQGDLIHFDNAANTYTLTAAALSGTTGFVQVLPETLEAFWPNYFWTGSVTDGDAFAIVNANTTLVFPESATTRNGFGDAVDQRLLTVDYDLLRVAPTDDREGRTAPAVPDFMVEDHQVPMAPNGEVAGLPVHVVKLSAQFLEDALDLPGFAPGVHVYAVDLATGAALDDASGTIGVVAPDGYRHGEVYFAAGSGPATSGHPLRFYYRTVENTTLRLFRPPAFYSDAITRNPAIPPGSDPEDYRRYIIAFNDGGTPGDFSDDGAVISFPGSSAGQAVAVDYDLANGARITGEVHTLPPVPSGADPGVWRPPLTLRQPGVATVVAVRGASVRGLAYWRSHNGNLHRVQLDTSLTGPPSV